MMYLICHITSHEIYGWALLVLCQYADKFCDHNDCDGGDIFLICHVAPLMNTFKECEFKGGRLSR